MEGTSPLGRKWQGNLLGQRVIGPELRAFLELQAKIDRLEAKIDELLGKRASQKDYYTTAEAAKLLGKKTFTVREWCRFNRVKAEKSEAGRGETGEWLISHAEIERYRNHGLLPIERTPPATRRQR